MFYFIFKVFRSFIFAFQGIVSGLGERNMKVHALATVVVFTLGLWLQVTLFEWVILLILMAGVLCGELMNTAIEELANIVRDELKLEYKATKRARDVAAGAVLMWAIVALIIGAWIFVPRLLALHP